MIHQPPRYKDSVIFQVTAADFQYFQMIGIRRTSTDRSISHTPAACVPGMCIALATIC